MSVRQANAARPSPGLPAFGDEPALSTRWRPSVPMFAAGGTSIIAGGLIAAVTGPAGWEHGSWVAAFLVLVAGVAQAGLGAGQAQLAPTPTAVRFAAAECALWNAGCLFVVSGTLLSSPVVVSIGGAPLVAVLAMSTVAVRRSARQPRLVLVYRVLLIVLLVSTPIGITLSWLRH